MLAVLLDLVAEQSLPVEMVFLLAASAMPGIPMVLADAMIPTAVRRLIMEMLSFFGEILIWILVTTSRRLDHRRQVAAA